MNEQHFRELSAARALHALSPEEEREFSRTLAAHPEWRSVVDEDAETAASLGEEVAEAAPPAAARASILDLIARTPQDGAGPQTVADVSTSAGDAASPGAVGSVAPTASDESDDGQPASNAPGVRAPRGRRALWFALAASVAVLLTVSLAIPWGDVLAPKDPVSIALQQVEEAPDAGTATAELPDGSTATLHWSADAGQAVFIGEKMHAAPTGHDYELWIVRGDRPISLGVMPVDRDGSTAVLAPGFEPGDAVAVTVEAVGGSPTGQPTTKPILVVASS